MNSSEQFNEIATALAKAQGKFPAIDRNRTVEVATKAGGKYKFTYATLDHIVALVRPILAEHGICFTQTLGPGSDGGLLVLDTRIIHESGQWIGTLLPIRSAADPQALGSELTYKRRYSLTALLGIAGEEDDDGNAAKGQVATEQPRKRPPAQPPQTKPPAQTKPPEAAAHPKPQPPSLDRVQERLDDFADVDAFRGWVAKCATYAPITANPECWREIHRRLLERLTKGLTNDGWDQQLVDTAADELKAVGQQIRGDTPPPTTGGDDGEEES